LCAFGSMHNIEATQYCDYPSSGAKITT
jgi:hypothetical protein